MLIHMNTNIFGSVARRLAVIFFALAVVFETSFAARAAEEGNAPQYYEIRVYATSSKAQQQRVNDYWAQAGVPAYNRMGIQPIGVFTEMTDSDTNKIYVLIPCDSLAQFDAIPAKLAADAVYQQAAGAFLSATKQDPAYERFSSTLLVAFNGMKHLVVPPADRKPNVFELRTYISASEAKGASKIKMFESGEITLMKDIGLAPVFYGRMLVGAQMPSLMYMTCGTDMTAHTAHWKTFGSAPVWKELQADPQYKDNVSTVIKVMLKRTGASQI